MIDALAGPLAPRVLDRHAVLRRLPGPVRDRVRPDALERLDVLTAALEARELSATGRAVFVRWLADSLARLDRALDEAPRHPSPTGPAPVVIVGFQRSGTTFLQRLLASDPAWRAFALWELLTPSVEVPEGTRRRAASRSLWANRLLHPEGREIHPFDADAPEECWVLFAHAVATRTWDLHLDLPGWRAFLDRPDVARAAYGLYRAQVDLLRSRTGDRRPLLKSPDHLWDLDALLAVWPGVRVVWIHREPTASLASFCSMVAMHRRTLTARPDPTAIGRHGLAAFRDAIARAGSARDARPGAVVDVSYRDLVQDPAATVRDLRARLGLPLDAAGEAALVARVAADPGPGRHAYALGDFGLDEQHVRRALSDYTDRVAPLLAPSRT